MLTIEEIQELGGTALAEAVAAYCVWGDYTSTLEFDATVDALQADPKEVARVIEAAVGRWTADAAEHGFPRIAKIDWREIQIEGDEPIETLAASEQEGWQRAALLIEAQHCAWGAELD